MKKMLSFKNLLFSFAFFAGCATAFGQTQIKTAYTNGPGHLYVTNAPSGQYMTFLVTNNNPYPVTITDIDFLHFKDSIITGLGYHINNNGAVYSLVQNPTSPAAPVFPGVGISAWTYIGSGSPITVGSTGITPVISGLKAILPPGVTYQYAVVSDDTLVARTGGLGNPPPTPETFTANGVILQTVDLTPVQSYIFWGIYPTNSGVFVNVNTPQYAPDMGITFRPTGPTVTIMNNNACIGDSVTLTAILPVGIPPGATINWVGPAFPGTHTGNSWTFEATSANAGQYFATYTNGTETSAPTAVTVTVTPTPPPPTVTGKFAYCLNEQFEPVTANGTDILWYINDIGGTGTSLPPYVNTTQSGSYTWYATQTTSNGCESSARTRVNITVAPKPAPPIVTSPIGYCENSPADSLKAIGQNLKWFYSPVGGLGSIFAPTPNTSVQKTFTWWVSQTVDGCESGRNKIDVVVTFRPNGMVVVSREPHICAGDTLSFFYYGSGIPTTAYDWSIPATGATIVAGSNGPGPFVVRFDTAGTHEVTLHPGNLGCYGDLYVQKVKIKPIPTAEIAAPQNVCKDATGIVSLLSHTPEIDSFIWGWDGGITTHSVIDVGPYGVYWPTTGKKTISLRVSKDGCGQTIRDTITIRELPNAKITGYDGSIICQSDSILLQPEVVVASSTYQWSPAEFFHEFANIPITNAKVDFDDKIRLDVEDEYGCINSDSVGFRTKACCEVVFPTAFTPNGDGKNDLFHPVYIGNKDKSYQNEGNKQLKTMRVVNRWGQAVFESANTNVGWDGAMNGEPQDMGTYYYFISFECNGKIAEQKGEVVLIR